MTWTTASTTTEMQNKMWSVNQGGKLSSLMIGKGLLAVSQDSSSLHLNVLSSWPNSYSIRAPHLTEINKFKREKNLKKANILLSFRPYPESSPLKFLFVQRQKDPHTYQFELLVIYSLTSQLKAYRRSQRLHKWRHKILPQSLPRWSESFIVSQLWTFNSEVQEEEFSRAELERLYFILWSYTISLH